MFDEPLDIIALLHNLAKDIEHRPTNFRFGKQDSAELEFDVAIEALREAADKIEKSVYNASKT